MHLGKIAVGDSFTIKGDPDRTKYTRIDGGTETTSGQFFAARSEDGVPGYFSTYLQVERVVGRPRRDEK